MREQIIILVVLIQVNIIQSQTPYDPWKFSINSNNGKKN